MKWCFHTLITEIYCASQRAEAYPVEYYKKYKSQKTNYLTVLVGGMADFKLVCEQLSIISRACRYNKSPDY